MNGVMGAFMRACGKTTRCMAQERWSGLMVNATRANTSKIRNTAMAPSSGKFFATHRHFPIISHAENVPVCDVTFARSVNLGLTETATLASGIMGSSMARGSSLATQSRRNIGGKAGSVSKS